jgi:diguanylate cyclase (GGDEF)-like protein
MKQIIDVLAKAVHAIRERDERYAREVKDMAQRLRSIASFKNLARIRYALVSYAGSLTACVERIAEDGRKSVRQLTTEVEDHRLRVDKHESDPSDLAPVQAVAGTGGDPVGMQSEAEQWRERASQRLGTNRRELKEIVDAIGRAVESLTGRDERYGSEVIDIAQRLQSIASLKDLARIRHAIVNTASSLTACVEGIVEDGRESLRRIAAEAEEYRSRVDSAERRSSMDLLTDPANRRRFEEHLNVRIRAGVRFCLILIALKDLKQVDSRFGPIAGNELSNQFALELRSEFPSADLVARCGRDRFAVIITTSHRDAEARVHRIRRAALAGYNVKSAEQFVMVGIDAAIGVVEWNGAETSRQLLARNSVKFSGS